MHAPDTDPDKAEQDPPHRRVVLLGASNVIRGIASLTATAHRFWPAPIALLVAAGHGRSYGGRSTFFGRSLPGIIESGLWGHLASNAEIPTTALVTDIGNDLMYQAPPEQIVGWLGACLDRLREAGASVVMTGLPVHGMETLSAAKFYLFRTLFFPGCRLSLEEVRRRAAALNELVTMLSQDRQVKLVMQQPHWYGLDPIHIRPRYRAEAWREMFCAISNDLPPELADDSWRTWLYLRRLRPARRGMFGIEQRTRQPAGRLAGGSTVSLY